MKGRGVKEVNIIIPEYLKIKYVTQYYMIVINKTTVL